MQPQLSSRSPEPDRATHGFRGAAFLPALAGALIPKCPICVAAYLSAVGVGAGVAQGAAPLVVQVGNAVVAIAIGGLGASLGMRVWRSRRHGLLALFALSASALLALGFAAPTMLWPRLVALLGVVVAVQRARHAVPGTG